jgi:hypothetical protein
MRKLISIVSGCYNEAGNVEELLDLIAKLMANPWKYEANYSKWPVPAYYDFVRA